MTRPLSYKVATRQSALAQKQSSLVCEYLKEQTEHIDFSFLPLVTQGDQKLKTPIKDLGGKGVFIKELQHALLNQEADFAIHSMKDMPLEQVSGLAMSGLFSDAAAHDVLVSTHGHWSHLPFQSKIGTSSLRRAAQILLLRPDLKVFPLRGNILKRLEQWRCGDYDALILAKAGLERMSLWEEGWYTFELHELVPAFNQGILCLESRLDRNDVRELCEKFLNFEFLYKRAFYERIIARLFGASCQSAIGIHVHFSDGDRFDLHIFAARSLKDALYAVESFEHIEEAVLWAKKTFTLHNKSWALCQNFFT